MNYEKALEFVRRSEYAKLATHQDENPINEHDCAMMVCEYGETTERMIAKTLLENEAIETELAAKDKQFAEARADARDRDNALAAIMAVLPDSAKPCDAPDLIRFFKQQMSAYSSRGIELEKQLADARAEIERKDKLIEQMREALRLTADEYSLHVSRYENRNAHDDPCYIAAEQALAAERGE